MFDPKSYMSTSYLVFKILKMPPEASWISFIGIKADKAEEECKDVVELALKHFPELKEREKKLINLISTSRNLDDARVVVNSLIEAYNMGGPSFLGKTPSSYKLLELNKKVYEYALKSLLRTKKLVETKYVEVYTINSKFNIQSILVSKLARIRPDKSVLVANLKGDIIHVEVRTPLKKGYSKFEKLIKGLIDDMGGHDNAFGFSLHKEKFPQLLETLSKVKF